MQKKEIIRLDARVRDVIATSVFRAELSNGHGFVAFAEREEQECARGIGPGSMIRVEMSPYDMSVGRLIWDNEAEAVHESTKLSEKNL